jgi:hypothetical protein
MERLSWVRPFDTIKSGSLADGNMSWFTNGQINACYQCCDRHDPEKIAITWEGNEVCPPYLRAPALANRVNRARVHPCEQPTDTRQITYGEMVSSPLCPSSPLPVACSRRCAHGSSPPLLFRRSQTQRVCQYANVLKRNGIKKGDRVIIYMVRTSPPAPLLDVLRQRPSQSADLRVCYSR